MTMRNPIVAATAAQQAGAQGVHRDARNGGGLCVIALLQIHQHQGLALGPGQRGQRDMEATILPVAVLRKPNGRFRVFRVSTLEGHGFVGGTRQLRERDAMRRVNRGTNAGRDVKFAATNDER